MYYYIMNFVHDRHSPFGMSMFPLTNAHYIVIIVMYNNTLLRI